MNDSAPQPRTPSGEIAGLVERVTFFNEESGFAVLRVKVRGQRDLVTVLGSLPSVSAGEWLTAKGWWVRDKEHGLQFKAQVLKATPPTTSEGVERYLGGGFVKGVGPVLASDGYVPLHPLLAERLKDWHTQTPHAKAKDFVFPSLTAEGKVPLSSCSLVKDHLRPAAKAVGVPIADGQRFGLHNLRHSLSNWLVNKGKVGPKTVQSLLRHAKIQTTLDLYTQEDSDETRAAQGSFLSAMGMRSGMVQ